MGSTESLAPTPPPPTSLQPPTVSYKQSLFCLTDSSERLSQHSDDSEDAEDERDTPNEEEDEENDAGREEEEEEEENSDTGEELSEREEVVKIRPGQSSRETEEEDEDERQNADFEDTEDGHDLPDNRMMDGGEDEKALADQENVADEGGFNNFKQVSWRLFWKQIKLPYLMLST